MLCSSNGRVRHLSVEVLYRVGLLRRIFAANEPVPVAGQWVFKTVDSAYDVLNVAVVIPSRKHMSGPSSIDTASMTSATMLDDTWDVPFGPNTSDYSTGRHRNGGEQAPLARLAASSVECDIEVWLKNFPSFVQRAGARIPDVMLVARTLVCQRLYQMQPLMNQYADMGVRAFANLGGPLRATSLRIHDKALPRSDLVTAFNQLFLFAVISLPSSNSAGLRTGGLGNETVIRTPHGTGPSGGSSGGAGSSNSSSRNRLAKSLARKLAPLKTSSRGSKQEQGVGLASIAQLVRIASSILRSDNWPLRQRT
ncbi:hypothetical protein FBU59_007233, partial [Linderina macrospora]